MREVLGPIAPVRMVRVAERWSLALVDSQLIGHEEGKIADTTLSQLRDDLARVQTHVVVCLHHPPISTCEQPARGLSDGHGGDPHYTDTGELPAAQLVELRADGEVSCRVVRAG